MTFHQFLTVLLWAQLAFSENRFLHLFHCIFRTDLMALNLLPSYFAHRFSVLVSFLSGFSYSYVRQTKSPALWSNSWRTLSILVLILIQLTFISVCMRRQRGRSGDKDLCDTRRCWREIEEATQFPWSDRSEHFRPRRRVVPQHQDRRAAVRRRRHQKRTHQGQPHHLQMSCYSFRYTFR